MEVQKIPGEIAENRSKLASSIEEAEARRKAAADTLAKGETTLREAEEAERNAERTASEAREARARAEAVSEAAVIQVDQAADRIPRRTGDDAAIPFGKVGYGR